MKTLVTLMVLAIGSSSAFASSQVLKCSLGTDRNVYNSFDNSVDFEITGITKGDLISFSTQQKVTDAKLVNHVIEVNSKQVSGGVDLVLSLWKHDGKTAIGQTHTSVGALIKGRILSLSTGTEQLSCILR